MSVAATNYKVLSNWRKTSATTTYGFVTVASSSDGTILAAGIEPTGSTGKGVSISLDSGNTWALYGPTNYDVSSIALSADGSKIVVVGDYAFYISQSPFTTWTTPSSIPATYWVSITCSDDFQYLAAAIFSGGTGIWVSSDSGNTFAATSAPASTWLSITSSSDGSKLAAVDNNYIYTSTSPFTTWTNQTIGLGLLTWVSITCASDFSILFAVVENAGIWKSSDSGITWTQTSAPYKNWSSITCSNDGTIVAAVAFNNFIWISIDSGTTWIQSSAPNREWYSIACSGDGLKLVAAHYGNSSLSFVYTGTLFADLADIFQALPPGGTEAITTNYNVPTLGDLNNVFAPLSFGTSIGFNTQYTVTNADLSTIFAAKLFSITPASIYSATYSGGYYTIALTGNGTITFNQSLTGIQVVVVGGGGGGGSNDYNGGSLTGTFSGGGGGAGGDVVNSNVNIMANTPYSFTIGDGGVGNNSGGVTGGTSSFNTISAGGGLGGANCVNNGVGGAGATGVGGGGGGGNGGSYSGSVSSTNGSTGSIITIGITSYYFGGGGAGGSYNFQPWNASSTAGGLGGGGGSGPSTFSNNNTSWISPTGTPSYPQGYDNPTFVTLPRYYGWPSTGGGGAGGNGSNALSYISGGTGGSGIVVLHFQYP